MKKKVVSIIFYLLGFLFLLWYLFVEVSSNMFMSEFGRLFLLCGSCLFLYFGGFFISKDRSDNKYMKINLWIFFILYCILLITLTMFDPMWGRNGLNLNWTAEQFKIYIENSVNIIPFKTIFTYIKGIFSSLLDTSTIFFNLFGNLICLMPLALFIPKIFKKIDNSKKFLIVILSITLSIELIQFITFTGSCDIDDIILNALGAFIMYKILNIKDIDNLIDNVFLLEKNKINIKKIIFVLIPSFLIIFLCFGLYRIGLRHYDNNLDDWLSKRNYKLEIIEEIESCPQELEKFYESELYEYYFNCVKSDYVYAVINDKEKYLVKDLLNNNPTDYIVSINKLQQAGLEFTEKEKYTKIEILLEDSVYLDKEKIENENVLEIGWGKSTYEIKNSLQEVFLIPKNEGKTKLSFDIYDSRTNELIDTKIFNIVINSNLEVVYEEL